jgi:hypothetical protein
VSPAQVIELGCYFLKGAGVKGEAVIRELRLAVPEDAGEVIDGARILRGHNQDEDEAIVEGRQVFLAEGCDVG